MGALNPYNGRQLDYLEDVYAGTLAGAVVDKLHSFVWMGGIKPVFELIDTKDKEDKQIEEELKTYDDFIDQLLKIDEDTNFISNAKAASLMEEVYGRGVLAFEPATGKPEQLKVIHTRDLQKPETVSPTDWTLKQVGVSGADGPLQADQMIYFVNQPNSPVRRAMWYGYSELQRVLGIARALNRIVEYDAPEIAHSMWASYGLIIVNTDGKTEGDATTQLTTIMDGMKPGAFNAISGKPKEDVEYIPMDLEAKVGELVQLVDMYERIIIGNSGLPGPLLGREEESNMATLFGKIRLFLAGPVQSKREARAQTIAKQWYERNLKLLDGGAAILEKVRVKAEFEPITIESWVDVVPALQQLNNAIPGFPDSAKLELAGLEQYKDALEEQQAINEEKQKEMFKEGGGESIGKDQPIEKP